jgi:hypothetical protein
MTEDDDVVLARGTTLTVYGVRRANGTCPSLEFLCALGDRPRAQLTVLLERMASDGRILGEERFRKLRVEGQPEVWEFKAHDGPGWRLYAIAAGRDWYATHGGKKPHRQQRVRAEARRARAIFRERSGR